MRRRQTFLYILLTVFVVGLVGGLSYWHFQNSDQTRQAKKLQKKSAKESANKASSQSSSTPAAKRSSSQQPKKLTGQALRITNYLRQNHFVGSALIVRNGRVIYRRGLGYANYAKRQPNLPNSQYQILSIQKSLTAVQMMKLVVEKRLSLNTKLAKFYPAIPNANRITIRNLLDMDSGLSMATVGANVALSEKRVIEYAVTHVDSRETALGQWDYQPVNYVLLAGIIGKLTKQSYRQNFYQTFVYPLNLRGTGFVQRWPASSFRTIAYRYQKTNQAEQNYEVPFKEAQAAKQNELGTGQVYMSPIDLFKAERAILRGRIISRQAVAALHAAGSASTYGGGVYNLKNGIRSHGIGYGYEAVILITRGGQNGVVLLSNNYRPAQSIQKPAIALYTELLDGQIT